MLIKTDIQEISDFYNKIQVAHESYEKEITNLSKQLHLIKQEKNALSKLIYGIQSKAKKELLTNDSDKASDFVQRALDFKEYIVGIDIDTDLPF